MSDDLYGILKVARDATPEQIRKAYRKRALETHPDRAQDAQASSSSSAKVDFRKVNEAYEVLKDPIKRQAYDTAGVWPLPAPSASRRQNHSDAFPSDPFFGHQGGFRFGGVPPPPSWNSPFDMWAHAMDSMHADFAQRFGSHPAFAQAQQQQQQNQSRVFPRQNQSSRNSFENDPFFASHGSPFGPSFDAGPFGFGGFSGISPAFAQPRGQPRRAHQSDESPNVIWTSSRFSSSTVNGVTQSQEVKRDSEGNEHVWTSGPNGKTYTINGLHQGLPPVERPQALPRTQRSQNRAMQRPQTYHDGGSAGQWDDDRVRPDVSIFDHDRKKRRKNGGMDVPVTFADDSDDFEIPPHAANPPKKKWFGWR